MPGVRVGFRVEGGGGSVSPASVLSNERGEAAPDHWIPGERPGVNILVVEPRGLAAARFEAMAAPGPPALLERASAKHQWTEIGTPVAETPTVRVLDRFANPVPGRTVSFSPLGGSESVQRDETQTDVQGLAHAGEWILLSPGPHALEARVSDLESVFFMADAEIPSGFNLTVEAVHLNQGNQSSVGDIGGVSGRPGLLRVIVRANEPNGLMPEVRVRLYQGVSLIRELTLTRPFAGVPTQPNLNRLNDTWNVALAASEVVPGLSVEVEVDPNGRIPVSTRVDNRYPRGDGAASLDVQAISPLNVVFIPIHLALRGETGKVNTGNTGAFLKAVNQWISTSSIPATVRATYSTGLDLTKAEGWNTLVNEIWALRTAEGATDEYYHGIVPAFSGMGHGGVGYRADSPASTSRAALSHDRLPGAAGTVAHELGHNLGRGHSPCGAPENLQPHYPYADGGIGGLGWDILNDSIVDENSYSDYMSYCFPRWTSDYTYRGILEWRRADPMVPRAPVGASSASSNEAVDGLLLWGRLGHRGVVLNPAFTLTARPVLPVEGGPHELKGVRADGTEAFRFSFQGVEVPYGPGPAERHFSFFVPLSAHEIDALERVEVSGPNGDAAWIAPEHPAALQDPGIPPPEPRFHRLAGDRAQLSWDASQYPMALVRHRATGRILSFAREGRAHLSGAGLGAMELEILLSDGVRSRVWRPE